MNDPCCCAGVPQIKQSVGKKRKLKQTELNACHACVKKSATGSGWMINRPFAGSGLSFFFSWRNPFKLCSINFLYSDSIHASRFAELIQRSRARPVSWPPLHLAQAENETKPGLAWYGDN
jgi:hypothetical protein